MSAVDVTRERAGLKHNATARDVADQILQFCRADTVTRQVLVIDGGKHFH